MTKNTRYAGFSLDQCRAMALDAQISRLEGDLRPMEEFDPERILWLIEQVEELTKELNKYQ